jgi:hypothetical protein
MTNMFDCGLSTWLAMSFISVVGLLVLLVLLFAVMALVRYVLTGRQPNRPSAP